MTETSVNKEQMVWIENSFVNKEHSSSTMLDLNEMRYNKLY